MTPSEYAIFTASNSSENNALDLVPEDSEDTVIVDLGDSSGSDEDLGLMAKTPFFIGRTHFCTTHLGICNFYYQYYQKIIYCFYFFIKKGQTGVLVEP